MSELKAVLRQRMALYNVEEYGAVGDGTTNNTTAFAACMTALYSGGGGIMFFPAGVWLGQITLPATTSWLRIVLRGAAQPFPLFGTVGPATLPNTGSILKSSATSGSVVTVTPNTGNTFSLLQLVLEDMEVRTYDNPQINGIDAYYASHLVMRNVFVNTGVFSRQATQPTHGTAGIRTPMRDNGGKTFFDNVDISGFSDGLVACEHTHVTEMSIAGCNQAVNMLQGYHAMKFGRLSVMDCPRFIKVNGRCAFAIDVLNIERAPDGWQVTTYDVDDASNVGYGNLHYKITLGGSGDGGTFTKNGGTNIVCTAVGS